MSQKAVIVKRSPRLARRERLRIGQTLLFVLLAISMVPLLLAHTASSQQYTTVTVGYSTTTYRSLLNTTILSVSNVTRTIVQTNTATSQETSTSFSSTQVTVTDTLPSVNVTTVQPSFLEANVGWILPIVVFVGVFALLALAGKVIGIKK